MPEAIELNHIGLILDGNRRWAKKHGLPAYEGHLAGYNTLQDITKVIFDSGVKYVSVYVFSTENWKRTEEEVKKIMGLALKMLMTDLPIFQENNIKLKILGSRDGLDSKLINAIDEAERQTANNTKGVMAVCFNYGGQLEIVDAVKKIVQSGVRPEDVNVDLISQNIYVPEIPPMDLIVRTSGEHRLSNFMLWRSVYSEIAFVDKLWPDMKSDDIKEIIKEYNSRSRRFGK